MKIQSMRVLDTYSLPDGIGLKGGERDRQREEKK